MDNYVQDIEQAVGGADPGEVDAHRNLLSEVFQHLEGQGVDTSNVAASAGASTADPSEMSHGDLIQTTMALARQHPEVLQMVAQRFPEAQGILSMITGGQGGAQGDGSTGGGGLGGMLGGLLGRL